MKHISILAMTWFLCLVPGLRAEDAATEERLNRLAGKIDDLTAGQQDLRRQIDALSREVEHLRDQVGKPTGNYASQEDLKRVADAVKDVDRKRIDDAEKVRSELLKLQKAVSAPVQSPKRQPSSLEAPSITKPEASDKGYEYVINKGDTLSTVAKAYCDKNIKVTVDQILKANPGLKVDRLSVGQKIWIPAPQ